MPKPVALYELAAMTAEARAQLLRRTEADLGPFIERVGPIIEAVRTEGDVALARFARELDKAPVEPDDIKATEADFDAAF
jgi:histidinol dehydrogenase